MHERRQYRISRLMVLAIVIALMVGGSLFVTCGWNSQSNDRGRTLPAKNAKAQPTFAETEIAKKVNHWVNARYPKIRKRLMYGIAKLKNTLAGD